jgi:hypothetical protein
MGNKFKIGDIIVCDDPGRIKAQIITGYTPDGDYISTDLNNGHNHRRTSAITDQYYRLSPESVIDRILEKYS